MAGELIYARRYYVTDDGRVQSWESLLRDKETATALTKFDTDNGAYEDLLGVLPFVGNIESGLKCFDKTTITTRLRNRFQSNQELTMKRGFVSDIYSFTPDDSQIKKALDCANALPLLGYGTRLGLKATELAGLGRYASQFGKDFMVAMSFFDSGLNSGKKWEQVIAESGRINMLLGGRTHLYKKTMYDMVQNGKSIGEVAAAVVTLAKT